MNQEHFQEPNQNKEPYNDEVSNKEIPVNSNESLSENELITDTESSKNTIIIAVLAIIVVVLTLMYIWGSGIDKEITEDALIEAELQSPLPPDESIEVLQKVQTSDEIESIEEDLSATDVEKLDADLLEMETELNNEL